MNVDTGIPIGKSYQLFFSRYGIYDIDGQGIAGRTIPTYEPSASNFTIE
jgi:hypothetical protein